MKNGTWNDSTGMIESGNERIAKISIYGNDDGQVNARLIAEAPELLEVAKSAEVALLWCIAHTPKHVDVSAHLRVVDRIRAAVARVEGRTS